MLVGGDALTVDVEVGEGCALLLEDIGGTLAYPGEGRRSAFDVRIRVAPGGSLTWRAHPFVIADGAAVDRSLMITLGAEAVLRLRETLVLGRSGERGGALRSALRARAGDGSPLLLEDLDLDGRRPVPGLLGAHRVLDSVLMLGRRPAAGSAVPAGADVLHLEAPGALARAVADATHITGMDALFEDWADPPA
jgi:urease accessory protein